MRTLVPSRRHLRERTVSAEVKQSQRVGTNVHIRRGEGEGGAFPGISFRGKVFSFISKRQSSTFGYTCGAYRLYLSHSVEDPH
jgi:hypothetical protein